MATSTQTIQTSITDNTALRAFINNYKAGIEAVGLVATSDTGQVDTATVIKPTGSNVVAGFTMHRFDDALQTASGISTPVFIKTEYGSSNGTSVVGLWITVGSETDGAGTLTGSQVGTRFRAAFQSQAAQSWSFSGENNRLTVAGGVSSGYTNNFVLNVERLRDSTGAVSNSGISTLISYAGAASYKSTQQQVIPRSGAVLTQHPRLNWPSPGQSQALNSNVYFTTFFPHSYQLHQPCIGLLKYFGTDVTTGSSVSVGVYGSTATYLTLGVLYGDYASATYGFPVDANGGSNNQSLAIRWQ